MPDLIQPSPEIWHRDDYPLLCNWRKLNRVAEIGVDRAEWANLFLSRWIGDDWWGIDSYEPYPDMPYDRHTDYLMAVERLAPHARRAKLLRHRSVDAAKLFKPNSLDFVYIDGAHDAVSVMADLVAWWPTVSDHGILAGHDFDETHPGVIEAVSDFAESKNLTIYLTAVEGFRQEECPSWYAYKSGLPGPDWRRC